MPGRPLQSFVDLADPASAAELRRRRWGVVETSGGRLHHVAPRPWPHLLAWRDVLPLGPRWRPNGPSDRCRLHFSQPRGHDAFLALKYVACTPGTSYATLRAALTALDAIAAIKGVDAIVCDAANRRLSDRFLARMGWEPHAPGWRRRNFIRRFYGDYPAAALRLAGLSAEASGGAGAACAVGLGAVGGPC